MSDVLPSLRAARRTAVIDSSQRYRYELTREYVVEQQGISRLSPFRVTWAMLNPSKADIVFDDPTIRKVWGFSCRKFPMSGLCVTVVNLYALRSTNPRGLRVIGDPIGPENDGYIEKNVLYADRVIVGWGGNVEPSGPAMHERVETLLRIVRHRDRNKVRPLCLGITANRSPKHPLMLGYDTPLQEWLS